LPVLAKRKTLDFFHGSTSLSRWKKTFALKGKQKARIAIFIHL
jgi:hypothetical protein